MACIYRKRGHLRSRVSADTARWEIGWEPASFSLWPLALSPQLLHVEGVRSSSAWGLSGCRRGQHDIPLSELDKLDMLLHDDPPRRPLEWLLDLFKPRASRTMRKKRRLPFSKGEGQALAKHIDHEMCQFLLIARQSKDGPVADALYTACATHFRTLMEFFHGGGPEQETGAYIARPKGKGLYAFDYLGSTPWEIWPESEVKRWKDANKLASHLSRARFRDGPVEGGA